MLNMTPLLYDQRILTSNICIHASVVSSSTIEPETESPEVRSGGQNKMVLTRNVLPAVGLTSTVHICMLESYIMSRLFCAYSSKAE